MGQRTSGEAVMDFRQLPVIWLGSNPISSERHYDLFEPKMWSEELRKAYGQSLVFGSSILKIKSSSPQKGLDCAFVDDRR